MKDKTKEAIIFNNRLSAIYNYENYSETTSNGISTETSL